MPNTEDIDDGHIALRDASADDFEPHVNSVFQVHSTEVEGLPLKLVEVTRYPSRSSSTSREPFSLLFSAPLAVELAAGLHSLQREDSTTLQMFLSPITIGGSREEDTQYYEAVFS